MLFLREVFQKKKSADLLLSYRYDVMCKFKLV